MVMPGTLMYECCAHALRFLLARLGWVGEKDKIAYEPVVGVKAVLKCRGPVLQSTKTVRYQVEIKEIGYNPQPYVIADAIMYADNKRVVGFENVSMQLTGTTGQELEELWHTRQPKTKAAIPSQHLGDPIKPGIFNEEQFMQFAIGSPSLAFGPEFAKFDSRFIARLPGPPYQFVSRIVSADHPFLKAVPGGWVEAQYDIPADAWYFKAGHTGNMPFCVLNEITLQVCGWVSSYAGSSMHSEENLHYRNLGGSSRLYEEITPQTGTVTIKVRMTKSSEAGGLIIQDFDMWLGQQGRTIYEGQTTFGFFTEKALADQVGVRGADKRIWHPQQEEPWEALPRLAPLDPNDGNSTQECSLALPGKALLMLDEYTWYPQGGRRSLGAIIGKKKIDPQEWFFKAHFFQDPVMPGSLGLEAFIQVLKVAALKLWPDLKDSHHFSAILPNDTHKWLYRGQVIQANKETTGDLPGGCFYGDAQSELGKVAFLFPGQGSQYVGMDREFFSIFPEALEALETAHNTLEEAQDPARLIFPIKRFVEGEDAANTKAITDTRAAQPCLGAVESSVAAILRNFGVEPQAMAASKLRRDNEAW